MSEYVDCRTCQTDCVRAGGNFGFTFCDRYSKKRDTNADRIRAMSDEELAKFLDDTQRMECESLHVLLHDGTIRFDSCKNGWLAWLQQPAEEDDHA